MNAGRTGTQSPGQPYSTNLTATNTTCAANVATSTIPNGVYTVTGDKGMVGLQGRAQSSSPGNSKVILVRSKDPTFEYVSRAAPRPRPGARSSTRPSASTATRAPSTSTAATGSTT